MKHILIVVNNMNVGGIQKSLLELLKVLSQCNEFQVSLFCCNQCGGFLKQIPKRVKILESDKWAKVSEITVNECKELGTRYYVFRVLATIWTRIFNKKIPARMLCHKIKKLGEYDLAISYSQPINDKAFCTLTNEVVINCCEAQKKITFVHCDFKNYGGNTRLNHKLYQKFDNVAAVSNSVGEVLAKCIPQIKDRIMTVYNFCDVDEIEQLSKQTPIVYSKKTFVTVARLSEEKGLLRCVKVFDNLKKDGYDFEWHIVGGGSLYEKLQTEIKMNNLEKNIYLEGQQLNPYRYIKNANYFLLPSYHEAAPMVYNEAHVLGVPMLTTRTLSAVELVEKKNIGLVCENSTDAIQEMLQLALSKELEFDLSKKPSNKICLDQFKNLFK